MRAVADNSMLASIRGVNPDLVRHLANFLGTGLAGLGGMLIALDTNIDPQVGFRMSLPIFAAAILGGMGSVLGALLGALIVGVAEMLSLLIVEPIYRSGIGFLVIMLVLACRPSGLLGDQQR